MKLTFVNVLLIVFVVLKLCRVIDWSWWWVTSPAWITFILAVIVGVAQQLTETPHERALRALRALLAR